MAEVNYKIIEHIGVIDEYKTGWKKELNIVSWNDGDPKYDIREWNEDHTHLTRGITLKPAEMDRIVDLIYKRGKEKANEAQD